MGKRILNKCIGFLMTAVLFAVLLDGKCAACGALDPNNTPLTGDSSNAVLWIALLTVSGCAVMTLLAVYRKRHTAV